MLTASDLAGLNPEDVQALLGTQQGNVQLLGKAISDVQNRELEKERLNRDTNLALRKIDLEVKLNSMNNEAKKELAKLGFDNDKTLLTMKLNDPNALAELNANIKLANARAGAAAAEATKTKKETEILEKTGGVKAQDKIDQARLDATIAKNKIDQLNDLRKAEFDLGNKLDDPKVAGDINFINTLSERPEYIYQWVEKGKFFDSQKGEKLQLPVIQYNGKPMQLRSKDIVETAIANKISEREVLKQLGVLDNDFRPIKNK